MKPANHTAAELLIVPVLPAASRPRDMAAPVRPASGPSITWLRMAVTLSATSRRMTREQFAAGTLSSAPSRSVTRVIATLSQCSPWLANVAYASATPSGVTLSVPSVKEGTRLRLSPLPWRSPIDSAISAGRHSPVRFSSAMK